MVNAILNFTAWAYPHPLTSTRVDWAYGCVLSAKSKNAWNSDYFPMVSIIFSRWWPSFATHICRQFMQFHIIWRVFLAWLLNVFAYSSIQFIIHTSSMFVDLSCEMAPKEKIRKGSGLMHVQATEHHRRTRIRAVGTVLSKLSWHVSLSECWSHPICLDFLKQYVWIFKFSKL